MLEFLVLIVFLVFGEDLNEKDLIFKWWEGEEKRLFEGEKSEGIEDGIEREGEECKSLEGLLIILKEERKDKWEGDREIGEEER